MQVARWFLLICIWAYLVACMLVGMQFAEEEKLHMAILSFVLPQLGVIVLSTHPRMTLCLSLGATLGVTLPLMVALLWRACSLSGRGGADIGYGLFMMSMPFLVLPSTFIGFVLAWHIGQKLSKPEE